MTRTLLIGFLVMHWAVTAALAADAGPKGVFLDPAEAGFDYQVQGEYAGTTETPMGPRKWGTQVIALGDGEFQAVAYRGGLPGDGWDGSEPISVPGQRNADTVKFTSPREQAVWKDGAITAMDLEGTVVYGKVEKVQRKSPTLGAKPPAGAVVLFDGTSVDHFIGGKMTEDGLLEQGVTSKQKFQSFSIHLEFRTPFMPAARGQARGNSGFYAQGRYEAQILDSFGLKGEDNECGGIYEISDPKLNMCLPPLAWQTYDIDFKAAKYDNGKKVEDARMTVRLNGVLVQDNVEIPRATRAAPVQEGPEPGPVFLQDHLNPVRFRNIWIVEKN
jgi:hypothetical protein